jgi:hypothetical protein
VDVKVIGKKSTASRAPLDDAGAVQYIFASQYLRQE